MCAVCMLLRRSDNTFAFNFVVEDRLASTSLLDTPTTPPPPPPPPPPHPQVQPTGSAVREEGQGSEFAFNFHVPAVRPDHMDSQTPPGAPGPVAREPAPTVAQEACVPSGSPGQCKSKKKKRTGKKKTTDTSSKSQEKTSSSEGSRGDGDPVLPAEQQLQRELDWCIEKLELGLRTQKGTPKQKEDASRALKILRSSKAPLAKKRQVMRAMTGDYRKKMEEEKEKQMKLIQSAMTSLQVKTVSGSSKKSVFHRRAEVKTQVLKAGEESTKPTPAQASDQMQSENKTSQFVFTPSKEEFKFNFV
ncbi:unnamed protein product [Merluccius merluccius]